MLAYRNLPWWSPARPWGFRFSRADLTIILISALVTVHAAAWMPDLAILTPFVVGHFFLFCNVFRVRESDELLWSALLLLNVVAFSAIGDVAWWWALLVQGIVTLLVVVRTLLRPDYHGVCCQRVNPLGYRLESRSEQTGIVSSTLRCCRTPTWITDLLQGRSSFGRQ